MKITNMHRIRIRLRNAYFADRYCHLVEKTAGFLANSSQFDKIFNYGLKTCWSNEILVFPDVTFTQFRLLVLDIMNSSIGQSVKEDRLILFVLQLENKFRLLIGLKYLLASSLRSFSVYDELETCYCQKHFFLSLHVKIVSKDSFQRLVSHVNLTCLTRFVLC